MRTDSENYKVWRISKARFATDAFSGEGARLFSGRWNPASVRMVYTSSSLALAAMEFFVHLDPTVAPDDLVSITAEIPANLFIERLEPNQLPSGWRALENETLQTIGRDWALSLRSVALEVPSVAVDGEWNILLNPAHPGFRKIRTEEPRPFHYDSRMFGKQ